jgi:acetoacetyl-CoA synthetase
MTSSGTPLWTPSEEFKKKSNLSHYINWLAEHYNLSFNDYHSLWQWSVADIDLFWTSLWKYFDVMSNQAFEHAVSDHPMPYTKWFEGAEINYAEHIFRNSTTDHPALIFKSEQQETITMSWAELELKVAAFKKFLTDQGVTKGDRVAAYLPNIPEATIAFLATNSIGAVWSSTSPDFGTSSVVDRFKQIEPKILVAVNGYFYGGKTFDRKEAVKDIIAAIDSIETVILVPNPAQNETTFPEYMTTWSHSIDQPQQKLTFTRVPFSHPIWVLYSSGTTGMPKPITHSNGGVLLEHLKYLTFHNNVMPGDRCFWYTTTGWMMWNYIHAAMLCGGTVVLYDGSPAYPDINVLWRFAEEIGITHFGTSAGYIVANMKAHTHPGSDYDLSRLVSLGSTGSPLPPEGFNWVYQELKQDLWLTSISGGTDVCSAFVGGSPLLPVYAGEIQCRALGCKLEAFDADGLPVTETMGEMVITKPMPSMPIYFWHDEDFSRYRESYFDMYPGIWRHGDWTAITARQGVIIYGRSDSTLNRGGIRIGTSEIYRAVDTVKEVIDSMVVYVEKNNSGFMPLFVVLKEGEHLTSELKSKIKSAIRKAYTSRHLPDEIIAVNEIPYTISGKKMETPIKRILMGMEADKVIKKDAMRNPQTLDFFIEMAEK